MNENQQKIEHSKENKIPRLETYSMPSVTKILYSEIEFTGPVIGKGSYGEVSIEKWLKKQYAVKSIDMIGVKEKVLIREISILAA